VSTDILGIRGFIADERFATGHPRALIAGAAALR
jgi:hypothetical protein